MTVREEHYEKTTKLLRAYLHHVEKLHEMGRDDLYEYQWDFSGKRSVLAVEVIDDDQ